MVFDSLLHQRNSDTIEEATDELLDDIIEKHEYVFVYFSKQNYYLVHINNLQKQSGKIEKQMGHKKKQKTLIHLTKTKQSETDADYCCKTLAHGWVLTDELYRSICGLVTPI